MPEPYKTSESEEWLNIVEEPEGWVGYLQKNPLVVDSNDLSYFIMSVSKKGIPYIQAKTILGSFKLGIKEISNIIGISDRTLQRNIKDKKMLNINQSEKILEAGVLLHKGTKVFGNKDKFLKWMYSENPSFDGRPIEYIETNTGIHLIIEALNRIEHGIY